MMITDCTNQIEQVSFEPLARLLHQFAPKKASDLDSLLTGLKPICELDRQSDRILFQASLNPCKIRVGVRCTCRLQAHAYVAGVFVNALSTATYSNMDLEEKRRLYAPADHMLNWAVSRELQQTLKSKGIDVPLDPLLEGLGKELPDGLLTSLNERQRIFGEGLFRIATAFILLHEIAHLHFGHTYCEGEWSIQQEKDADRFAADWLLESATNDDDDPQSSRINVLFGIAVALLWLTVSNVYFGPQQSKTHPEAYDRLFQVLDCGIRPDDDEESSMVWHLVSCLLFVHMDNAGFEFDPARMQGSPRDEVNYLIDLISQSDLKE